MSLPLMISLLVQSLYNIVDSIFVARLGQDALTAVSLAYPVQILMIAVAVGTSVGINSLLSKSIGAKDVSLTANTATTGVLLALFGTMVFMVRGFFGSDRFARMFTDDPVIGGDCAAPGCNFAAACLCTGKNSRGELCLVCILGSRDCGCDLCNYQYFTFTL